MSKFFAEIIGLTSLAEVHPVVNKMNVAISRAIDSSADKLVWVKYIAYAYDEESDFISGITDRIQIKKNVAAFLKLDEYSELVRGAIYNENTDINAAISTYLNAIMPPDYRAIITIEEAMNEVMEVLRERRKFDETDVSYEIKIRTMWEKANTSLKLADVLSRLREMKQLYANSGGATFAEMMAESSERTPEQIMKMRKENL